MELEKFITDHPMVRLIRAVPAGLPGKMLLSKWMLKSLLTDRPVTVGLPGALVLELPSALEPLAYHLIINGEYEPETMAYLKLHGSGCDTFLDIGANVGYIALNMKRLFPQIRVVAFEPSHAIFGYLERNVERNGLDVDISELVVCEESGVQREFFPAPSGKFGMGSMTDTFGGVSSLIRTETVDSVIVDFPLSKKMILKVDVEGYEYQVFQGARELLQREASPKIVFEFCDWAEIGAGFSAGAAQEFLIELGYKLWRLGDYLEGLPPLDNVLREGAAMLVAEKRSHRDCLQDGV